MDIIYDKLRQMKMGVGQIKVNEKVIKTRLKFTFYFDKVYTMRFNQNVCKVRDTVGKFRWLFLI